jgi:hypothetical protein
VKEAKRYLRRPYDAKDGTPPTTFSKQLQEFFRVSGRFIPVRHILYPIDGIKRGEGELSLAYRLQGILDRLGSENTSTFEKNEREEALCLTRLTLSRIAREDAGGPTSATPDGRPLYALENMPHRFIDPFSRASSAAWAINDLVRSQPLYSTSELYPIAEPWYIETMHRVVVRTAIRYWLQVLLNEDPIGRSLAPGTRGFELSVYLQQVKRSITEAGAGSPWGSFTLARVQQLWIEDEPQRYPG